jgi:hypothetical protein
LAECKNLRIAKVFDSIAEFTVNFAATPFLMSLLLKWLLLFHPYYVSVAEINHNAKTESIEICVRIISNDLEETLRKNNPSYKVDLLSANAKVKQTTDSLINRYICSRFKLMVDGKAATTVYIGREIIEENTCCYFEVANIKSMKKLLVLNKLLYDWQHEQVNMHVVKYNKQEKTNKLNYPDFEAVFNF